MTVDAIWWDRRVVVELDGIKGHRSPARMRRDRRRELHCRRRGFVPLRYTEDMIDNEPDLVAEDVARELGLSRSALSA
jgi:very-short-patch-repair endonuclease